MRICRLMGAAGAIALTVLAAPVIAQAPAPGALSKKIELPAQEFHEECMDLAAGQRLAYAYKAHNALPFNIHYHSGDKIVYPVRKNARQVRASYMPHKTQGYCLMWANPRANPVVLEYSLDVGAAPLSK